MRDVGILLIGTWLLAGCSQVVDQFYSIVEPDRPSYGIRLSDKASDLRAWEALNKRLQLHEPQCVAKVLVREAACSRVGNLVLVA